MSVVTTGHEELGFAIGGGGGISFRWEECLADPVAVEYWALVFTMVNIVSLRPPTWCANLLRPTLRHLSSRMNTCRTTFALIGFVSGKDPPIFKLKRKIGEQ